MIAVDTNILVYAHREESPWFVAADRCLTELAEGRQAWAIAWPTVHEFLAIVTHPRIYRPPTPLADAIAQMECWFESPSLRLIGEIDPYWTTLKSLLTAGKIVGPQTHDARIAAICECHGVAEIWSADRDFSRLQGLRVKNPLLAVKDIKLDAAYGFPKVPANKSPP